jgi:hypothetical protein
VKVVALHKLIMHGFKTTDTPPCDHHAHHPDSCTCDSTGSCTCNTPDSCSCGCNTHNSK